MQAAADRRNSLFFLSFFYKYFRYHDSRSSFNSNYSEGWLHVPTELRVDRSSFLYTRKPRVRRVVQKRLAGEAERKTPFAIMRLRSSAAIEKAKGGHSKWD